MNNDITIGQNVKRIRRGIVPIVRQADLAKAIGMKETSVQAYECGRNGIAARNIPIIAAFLGCDIMDLFEGTKS